MSQERTITKKESTSILLASVLAAASAFIATVIVQRVLGGTAVAEFMLFWALLFGVYGVIAGITSEATRAVGAQRLREIAQDAASGENLSGSVSTGPAGARPTYVAMGIGAVIGALLVVTSPLWIHEFIRNDATSVAVAIGVATFLYAVQVAMSGNAAGLNSWYLMAAITSGEALWRLVAMVAVGVVTGSLWGLEAAAISPALLWLVIVLCSRKGREAFNARADVPAKKLTGNILLAMGSSAASAALTVGFPLMMQASGDEKNDAYLKMMMGALILAVSITRTPIMLPLQAFQGVAISMFLKQAHRPLAALLKPAGALLGIGAIGGVLAFLIGPWLFLLIYAPKPEQTQAYHEVAQGWTLGALTFASAFMALLVLTGTAVLALNLHKVYVAGWVIGAAVSLTLLFLPMDLVPRVLIALYGGPICGTAVHLAGMVARVRGRRSA